jgi:phosphatidylserine/phosphatidylglycerophosphate/cardiolipin synthase-like enzyme
METQRVSANLYARVRLSLNGIEGLPTDAALRLRVAVLEAGESLASAPAGQPVRSALPDEDSPDVPHDTLTGEDLIVGGAEHWTLLTEALREARTCLVLHSCFVDAGTVRRLLPELEAAARRNIRVDLLWGLRADPEEAKPPEKITEVEQVLSGLSPSARERIRLSRASSGSHAKVIVFDDQSGGWQSVVGSCNFLQSLYDTVVEVSLRSRSSRLALQLMGHLAAAQLPSSGGWPPVARRLDRIWSEIRHTAWRAEIGRHALQLLVDDDHYACIRLARDEGRRSIVLGCDIYGSAAERSVLVPMRRAAELGAEVRLYFRRSSRFLVQEGRKPDPAAHLTQGVVLETAPMLHGKYLVWDDKALAVTSFNWLSTAVDGTRRSGAELGVLVRGPELRDALAAKLVAASRGMVLA